MAVHIERIESAGPGGRARRLVFDGDVPERLTSAAAIRHLSLTAGSCVDVSGLDEQLGAAEPALAKERALRLLAYRERSTKELRDALSDDGYPLDVVDATVARLADTGLVDDVRFATAFVRSKLAAGFGPRRIRAELARRGIAHDASADVLSEALAESDEATRARAALRGSASTDRKERDRQVRRLVAKGFSLTAALNAVGRGTDASVCTDENDSPFVCE